MTLTFTGSVKGVNVAMQYAALHFIISITSFENVCFVFIFEQKFLKIKRYVFPIPYIVAIAPANVLYYIWSAET